MKQILILIGCVLALAAQAEPLGRLFHTPEQRALLNNARKTMPMNAVGEPEAPSLPDFTLNGVVTRSDGQRSVWLNDRLQYDAGRPGAQERNQVQVQLPGGGAKLKVGQSLDPTTGHVTENYRRAPPEPAAAKPTPPPQPPSKVPTPKARDEDIEPDKPTAQ